MLRVSAMQLAEKIARPLGLPFNEKTKSLRKRSSSSGLTLTTSIALWEWRKNTESIHCHALQKHRGIKPCQKPRWIRYVVSLRGLSTFSIRDVQDVTLCIKLYRGFRRHTRLGHQFVASCAHSWLGGNTLSNHREFCPRSFLSHNQKHRLYVQTYLEMTGGVLA